MKMACDENPKRGYGGRNEMPRSRLGSGWLMRRMFDEVSKVAAMSLYSRSLPCQICPLLGTLPKYEVVVNTFRPDEWILLKSLGVKIASLTEESHQMPFPMI